MQKPKYKQKSSLISVKKSIPKRHQFNPSYKRMTSSPITNSKLHISTSLRSCQYDSKEILSNTFIFMDLDGTLLPSKSSYIPITTTKPLHNLKQYNTKRILITGRGYESTIQIVKKSHDILHQHLQEQNEQNQCHNTNNNNNNDSIFDYIVTSSGAATSDHTYDIIDKRSLSINIAAKCTQYLHQNKLSYFIQHPIPDNHRHHQYSFQHPPQLLPTTITQLTTPQQHFLELDQLISLVINNPNKIGILPTTFCVEQYNLHLPTDHFDRIEFHQPNSNSYQLYYEPQDHQHQQHIAQQHQQHQQTHYKPKLNNSNNTIDPVTQSYEYTLQSLQSQLKSDQISQFVVPMHRHILIPISKLSSDKYQSIFTINDDDNMNDINNRSNINDDSSNINTPTTVTPKLPSPEVTTTTTPTTPTTTSQHSKYRLTSTCPCCSGDYMLYINPNELMHHVSDNLIEFLQLSHSSDLPQIDFKTQFTPVHCTSPFDHQSVWFEILPPNVNKDYAAHNIIQHVYTQELLQQHQSLSKSSNCNDNNILKQSYNKYQPLALFSFGNDYNDLPMLQFVHQPIQLSINNNNIIPSDSQNSPIVIESTLSTISTSVINEPIQALISGSYMIHTANSTLLQYCLDHSHQVIGRAEDGAVGLQIEQIVQDIVTLSSESSND